MQKRFLSYSIYLCLLVLCSYCARRGAPSGGDKDTTAPKMLKAIPELGSTNFNAKRIRIYFDEYIKFKDLQKQLIISPPMAIPPDITPRSGASKYIDIRLNDTLKANTTYVFNFGQSIVDNNQDNPYTYFKYVFATGDKIDTLKVTGVVKDAIAKKADAFTSVGLYRVDASFTDSIVYQKTPDYITNTLDSTTAFTLSNVKAGKYMLIGLKEKSVNYLFNPKSDKIGFLKQPITVPTTKNHTLTMFKEATAYKASVPSVASKNRIIFGYQGADFKDIQIKALYTDKDFKSHIVKDTKRDSLHYWFSSKTPLDSLVFKVTHLGKEDIFTAKLTKKIADSLRILPSHTLSLHPKDTFALRTNTPIVKVDAKKIRLQNKDSIDVAFTTKIHKVKNQAEIHFASQFLEKYHIQILPGAITDFFHEKNKDTLTYNLQTKSSADYANLVLKIKNRPDIPIFITLLDKNKNIVRRLYSEKKQKDYAFSFLQAGIYDIRVTLDSNKNKKIDTGNYLKKIQPEKSYYFKGSLELRANWDVEQEFSLE